MDVTALRRLWRRLRTTPREQPDLMTHGDLIPGNMLVADARLVGVLDTGGFGPADPALDLVAAWHLLGDDAREAFPGRTGLRRRGVESREGLGVRTGHRGRLVLPEHEPRHARDGDDDAEPTA